MRIYRKRLDATTLPDLPSADETRPIGVYDAFMNAMAAPLTPPSSYRAGACYQAYSAKAQQKVLQKALRDRCIAWNKPSS